MKALSQALKFSLEVFILTRFGQWRGGHGEIFLLKSVEFMHVFGKHGQQIEEPER